MGETPAQHFIDVGGIRVALRRHGTGAPLLFLHGASGAGEWSPLMARLAEQFEVVVPEHPGFGASDAPEWLDSVSDLAFFYLDLMETLDLDRAHVVGTSLGGWLGAEIAIRSTARIRSLTLAGAAGIHLKGVPKGDLFIWTPEELARNLFADAAVGAQLMKPPESEAELDLTLKNRVATARYGWQPRMYNPKLARWLHRIDVPTLVVWGAEDKVFPTAYADSYAEMIRGAELAIIPGCGHLPHLETPDAFLDRLLPFLKSAAS